MLLKKLRYLLNKNWQIFLILLVVILAYGQTLRMYWWVDDWGLVYKMIFPQDAPNPSNFGAGIFGQGAYRYNATPFIFLYPIFGLSVSIYYALGLFQYFLAAALLYLFLKDITGKKLLGLLSGIVFASGYIGSFAMYRLSNSYQLVETAIFLILTAWALIKHYQSGKVLFFWLSLLSYVTTLEFFFLRAHGVLIIVLASALFFAKVEKKLPAILTLALKQIPFIAFYLFFYFFDYRGGPESSGVSAGDYLTKTAKLLTSKEGPGLITNLLSSFTYLVIPDQIVNKVAKLFNFFSSDIFAKVVGGGLIGGLFLLFYNKVKQGRKEAKLILFGILWIFSNIFIYFIYMPTSVFDSHSRYAIPAFLGAAIIYATVFTLIFERNLRILAVSIVGLTLIVLTNKDESFIIRYVSIPDKKGYELIKREVPQVNKDTVFYIDTVDDPNYKSNVLGNIPQLGISSLFKYRGVTTIAGSYNELFYLLSAGRTQLGNIYTFFYSPEGYTNTTERIRGLLGKESEPVEHSNWEEISEPNQFLELKLNQSSLVPSVLAFTMKATPVSGEESYPSEGQARIWWITDRRSNYYSDYSQEFDIFLDGKPHTYTVYLPAQGTRLTSVKIDSFYLPLNISMYNTTIKSLSLVELEQLGVIHDKTN